jgi:hypothetical protein
MTCDRTRRFVACAASICLLTSSLVLSRASAADSLAIPEDVKTILADYCVTCHSNADATADLSLEKFANIAQMLDERDTWLTALLKIQGGEMPPADADPLPTNAKKKLLAWIDEAVNKFDCELHARPGRPVIRRLNSTEYRNTVRDLLRVDYEPAADFPGDDVGYGFDNIGDVLSLPPILLEKYLDAAEVVTSKAIIANSPGKMNERVVATDMDQGSRLGGYGDDGIIYTSHAEVGHKFNFPDSGEYKVRFAGFGDQAGNEVVKVELKLDGKSQKILDVPATKDEPGEYEIALEIPQGEHTLSLTFTNDFYEPSSRSDRNFILNWVNVSGPKGTTGDLPQSHRDLLTVSPTPERSWKSAATEVLKPFVTRAFRRPPAEDELRRLSFLVQVAKENGDSFETGIQLAVQAVLISPHFLYKVEVDPRAAKEKEIRQLNDYELATNLSYFIWSSMPDDELFQLAAAGKLTDQNVLEQQVKRMLADEKAVALVENFAAQWLQWRNLEDMQPDPEKFAFNEELRAAMMRETELFVKSVLQQDKPLTELLSADYTFVNESLAKHYGLAGVQGKDFRKVSLGKTPRRGLLTQASILTITSNPTRTSPVKRGKWVLENILGEPPPPPAPDVPLLEDQKELTGSLRQRMEQHRTNPSCASCHQRMDPIGFALENFDAVGRFRTEDEGHKIDPAGKLPDGEQIGGPEDLLNIMATKRKEPFVHCFTEKLLIYALGRGLKYYDQCAIEEITEKASENDYRFSDLVLGVVTSQPFRERQLQQRTEP